ncbi:MAG: Bdr protein [Gloeomargaritaceae cyanobacterium C42_A2020_066]|nr:Bdr protein [Gloeomargaritaceae cyanobacterium C42_A2020_066]
MGEPSSQEIKELILALDKKIDVGFAAISGEINRVEEKLGGEIKRVEEKLGGKIKRVEEKLGGEIKRLEGELNRIEEKINGIDKRLANEEFISRSAFTAVVVSVMAGLVKYSRFIQV